MNQDDTQRAPLHDAICRGEERAETSHYSKTAGQLCVHSGQRSVCTCVHALLEGDAEHYLLWY